MKSNTKSSITLPAEELALVEDLRLTLKVRTKVEVVRRGLQPKGPARLQKSGGAKSRVSYTPMCAKEKSNCLLLSELTGRDHEWSPLPESILAEI